MFFIKLDVLLPSRLLPIFNNEQQKRKDEIYHQLIHELLPLKLIWNIDNINIPVYFEYIPNIYQNSKELKNLNYIDGTLLIKSDVDVSNICHLQYNKYKTELDTQMVEISSLEEFIKKEFILELKKRFYDFFLCINLAYPGFFEVSSGQIWLENHYVESIPSMTWNLLYGIFFEQQILGKELIQILDIEKTWNWLQNKTNYIKELGVHPVDRALNACSYFIFPDAYEELFFALTGLEALYNTDSSVSILEQIRKKVELLFGEIPGLRKKISQMYDKRSKIIHGSIYFPSKFSIYDASEEYEKFFDVDYKETTLVAMTILIATIQQLSLHNAVQISSEYHIKFF